MTPSLERLSELVRQAEAKSRAHKLGIETHQAAEALRVAEQIGREAEQRLHNERPARLRELEDIELDEQKLKDLTRKVAQLLATSDVTPAQARVFEDEIETTRAELDERRHIAESALEVISREAREARRALKYAMEQYQQIRKELDRLQPQLAGEFATDDRLARGAELMFPSGQVHALAREIDDGAAHFGMLDPREQLAQLTIWIGRYRRLQASDLSELPEDDLQLLQRQFPKLVGISKQYEPGYIEGFRQGFHTDWDAYVAAAEEQMREATEAARRSKDIAHRRSEQQAREQEKLRQARQGGEAAIDELKAIITRYHLPEEGVEEFQEVLSRIISGLGAADPVVLELVSPYRDLLVGDEFRAIRKHLDRIRQDEAKEDSALQEEFQDLLSLTRGRKVLMIGGSVREESRRALLRVFEFDELEWENYEGNRPALLDSMEQRIRNQTVDLVLLLKNFIGHHVPERLRPLCEQFGVPCLMIEHGYGAAMVADALRRGLVKSNDGHGN